MESFPHGLGLTPNPLAVAELLADDEENPKLATDGPLLDSTRMEHLANFLCFSMMRGIRPGSFELVIMKGKGEASSSPKSIGRLGPLPRDG